MYLKFQFRIYLPLILIWNFLPGATISIAQNPIGQAELITFSRKDYGAGAQNWAMTRDQNHRLYVANNEGLLVLNGKRWQLFPVPNHTILRSIAFGPEGKLYAGAQDELGFFAPDPVGRLHFSSLKHLLPASDKKFPDVWSIVTTEKDVFFRTTNAIFQYHEGKMFSHTAGSIWHSLHKHINFPLAQDPKWGLLIWAGTKWDTLIPKKNLPSGCLISDVQPWNGDTSLISTEKNGLFFLVKNLLIPFSTQGEGIQTTQHFTSLAVLADRSFLAGTYFNGLFHFSSKGGILEIISEKNGLRNNTIRCLNADPLNGIWMGLDNGIAYYENQNAIRHIHPTTFRNGVGYAVASFQNELYFALSTGIQYVPIGNNSDLGSITAMPKPILNGLSWNVFTLENHLFAGRDDGLWTINNHQPTPVSAGLGFWTGRSYLEAGKPVMVAGNYFGIHLLNIESDNFKDKAILPIFKESSRFLEVDKNNIWVSHPYRGVYRIQPGAGKIDLFNQKDGLPSDLDNHVFRVKQKIVFATAKGVYEFNKTNNRMEKSNLFTSIFGDLPIRYLKEDQNGNIWFVQNNMVGVVDLTQQNPQVHYIPELKNKIVSGFENIFPFDSRNLFIGSDEGFYHLNFEKYKEKIQSFSVYLTQIRAIAKVDSTIFGGFRFNPKPRNETPNFPFRLNSLQFTFAGSIYNPSENLEYSYILDGFDKTWSEWSPKSEKDYTNLPAGNYTFKVKARRSPSHESAILDYPFSIAPPIYQTIWAYIFYVLLLFGFFYGALKFQAKKYRKRQEIRRIEDLKRFEEEQKQQAYQHQLELEKSEKEFIRLQNDKLAGEIEHKNAELTSATMNLVQKKEFILKLKAELQQLQKTTKVADDHPELKKLLKTLSEEEKLNKEWDHFAQHFDSVYGDFLSRLKAKFPNLKPHELHLCAYLRMNLSSKEIAPLMSISVRGVEIGRYRLRKKLNLNQEENLTQFLMNISG